MTDLVHPFTVEDFVRESNRIERIYREPTEAEIGATGWFLNSDTITVSLLKDLVKVYQPDAKLRDRLGLDVRVGNYYPPKGGTAIITELISLLHLISNRDIAPYTGHCLYESIHPFTDGNGRSGRAIWLWAMGGMKNAPLGFLHTFYYQALDGFQVTP